MSCLVSRKRSVFVLFSLSLLLAACTSPVVPAAPTATPSAPTHLKVGLQPFVGFAPLFIAQDEGYFAKHGIEVEFVAIKSSDEIVPLLMQGGLDMSIFAVYPGFFNGVAKGGAARAVFGVSQWRAGGCASTALLARPATAERLKAAAAWKGITIGTDPVGVQSMHGFFINHVLASQGLSLKDVKTVKLPPASMIDALQSGAVDVAQANEPWITRLTKETDAIQIAAAPEFVPNGQLSVIGFSARLLQDADLGRRVALAYLEGVRQYQGGNTDRNVAILAKYTKVEPELVRQMCWPAMPTDGAANLESLQAFQAWAVAQGLQDQVVSIDGYWDERFVGLSESGEK